MIGKLLCRAGFHDFAHAGYVAWNMYRISCTRGCGTTKAGLF